MCRVQSNLRRRRPLDCGDPTVAAPRPTRRCQGRSPVLSPAHGLSGTRPPKSGEFPNSTSPFFCCSDPQPPPCSRPIQTLAPATTAQRTNHHAPRRGFPQTRPKSTPKLRTSEFESEFSTCDAVEEWLHDAEGKGAPGGRWGGGATAGNRV